MSAIPLLCLGNPLLDIQATVTQEYLNKYDLKSNDAILVDASSDDPKMAIYDELMSFKDVKFIAGGASQNTARGAAYILGANKVIYLGSVGNDKFADLQLKENQKLGVVTKYQVQNDIGTGKCAALILGHDRSLVTDLGAANLFTPSHVDDNWTSVEQAKAFYVEGYHLTVSPESVIKLGKHAQETGKPLALNLSSPFIPAVFKGPLADVLPYASIVIGNEAEAEAFHKAFELDCKSDDLEAIARYICENFGDKTVIFTHGLEPTVVVKSKDAAKVEYAVKAIPSETIVDTNGAGDAFAAGYMAGLILEKPMNTCVDMGQWLAAKSLLEVGASYPEVKYEYSS